MASSRILVAYRWRWPKIVLALMIIEIPFTIAFLALSGIADNNTYRTKLWKNGSVYGFNSNPIEILYSYANYQPIKVPLIWSSFLTEYNIVVSVFSMFVLLVKSAMFVLHAFVPLLSLAVHAILIALYAVAVRNQSASDLSDPAHPSRGLAWYLSKGCGYATAGNYSYCMQARASYAVSIVMMGLFVIYFGLSIHSAFPTPREKSDRLAKRQSDIELKEAVYGDDSNLSKAERWEKNRAIFLNLPKTPNTPYTARGLQPMTPRTNALSHLSGEAGPSVSVKDSSGPSRPLAFREQYGDGQPVDGRTINAG